MDMKIKKITEEDDIPYDLLLLADPSKDLVNEYVNRGSCYIAVKDQEEIGVFVLLPTRPDTVEIVNIAVAPSYQGMGIGKSLVLHAIEKARDLNVKTVELGSGNSSMNQLALYQKCGFRITGVDKDFFIRHYNEEIFENGIQCIDMVRLSMDLS